MNGRLVGLLRKLSSGAMTFQYADEWLTTPGARPISLSLPLRSQIHEGTKVYNFSTDANECDTSAKSQDGDGIQGHQKLL